VACCSTTKKKEGRRMVSLVWLLMCFAVTVLSQSNCNVVATSTEPIKVVVPLYVYPGTAWDEVITAASSVSIVAIINPNSGPGTGPDSTYTTFIQKLHTAGITIIGYVHTTWGARSLSAVQADIDLYARDFLYLSGIFVDEADNTLTQISYYTSVYNYIKAKSGYTEVFINPGTATIANYLPISTNIMIYENSAANINAETIPSFVLCPPSGYSKSGWKYRFSAAAYAASASQIVTLATDFQQKGIGYLYITDQAGGCCTYNNLATYFATEVADITALN